MTRTRGGSACSTESAVRPAGWISGPGRKGLLSSLGPCPFARRNNQRVSDPPPARQRQRQSGELYYELCRWPPVKVESVPAPESTLVGRVGKEACEGCALGLRRNNEHDDAILGAHRGSLRELRLQLVDPSPDDETWGALDYEAMRKRVVDFGAQHDPRPLVSDHESAPALPLATGYESSLIDAKAHRPTVLVEEACIGGDDSGERRDNPLYGAPKRGA